MASVGKERGALRAGGWIGAVGAKARAEQRVGNAEPRVSFGLQQFRNQKDPRETGRTLVEIVDSSQPIQRARLAPHGQFLTELILIRHDCVVDQRDRRSIHVLGPIAFDLSITRDGSQGQFAQLPLHVEGRP